MDASSAEIRLQALLPKSIQSFVVERYRAWAQGYPEAERLCARCSADDLLASTRLLALSDFAYRHLQSEPEWLEAIMMNPVQLPPAPELEGLELAEAQSRLRRWRQRCQVQLIWRDSHPSTDISSSCAAISDFAEQALLRARDYCHSVQLQATTNPQLAALLREQPLQLIAMGKLGARELNLSSDVDLILTHPDFDLDQDSQAGVNRFYLRCARSLLALLDQNSADGRVLRVDLRLRPFGTSGALVLSQRSLLNYYREHGREWERYALVKARLLASQPAPWLEQLSAFVYRPFRDFRSYQQLRELRGLIATHHNRDAELDIKRCVGGIRDAEFAVQVVQLINGGRYRSVQQRSFLGALAAVRKLRLLSSAQAETLQSGYLFLRALEHKIQAFADAQSHSWPADPKLRARLAFTLGYPSADALAEQLERHLQAIERLLAKQHLQAPLPAARSDPEPVESELLVLANKFPQAQSHFRAVCAQAAKLQALGQVSAGYERHLQSLLLSIRGRDNYLALLAEEPQSLRIALQLMQHSEWLAEQICNHPLVLENFALRSAAHPKQADFSGLQSHYRQYLQRLLTETPSDDLEAQMDCLRRFKHHAVMHVARLDVLDKCDLMLISDHLSAIADALLITALQLSWQQSVARLQVQPVAADGSSCRMADFMIVALGKLGGLELGYGSDCDLVFVYDAPSAALCSGAGKAISNQQFFLRLAQRLLHLLNSYTTAGRVFDIDLRLRPAGAKGLLVSQIDAYADYQLHQAWTFETQAITRARVLSADEQARARFERIRAQALSRERASAKLRADLFDMRLRIAANKSSEEYEQFDVKLSPGGLVDVEFLVQYLLLRHAQRHPEIIEYSDNYRQLKALARARLLAPELAQQLSDCWLQLRRWSHQAQLQSQNARVPLGPARAIQERVVEAWRLLLGGHWRAG